MAALRRSFLKEPTVTMYREDASTSSEDDTSTAGATTADMCRSGKLRNGEKVLKCTGCGYTSDRRANVTRHYRRIHCKLEKYKKCDACGDKFPTKGAFYKHCAKFHPKLRQSSYTTTHVYKIDQTKVKFKSKSKSVKKHYNRIDTKKTSVKSVGLATRRTSSRLKIQGDRSSDYCTSNDPDSSVSSIGVHDVPSSSSTDSSVSSIGVQDVPSSSSADSSINSIGVQNVPSSSSTDSSSSSTGEIKISFHWHGSAGTNYLPGLAHLPLKKRYSTSRRVLGDITNFANNVGVQMANGCQDDNNNSMQVIHNDMSLKYLSSVNEQCRAFISHIDFDELDAILTLQNIKRTR